MKLAQSHRLAPPGSAAGAEPRLTSWRVSTGGMATAESKAASADSELQHSFGLGGVGFDFLPLELPGVDPSLPTGPQTKLPVIGLESAGPLPVVDDRGADAPRSPAEPAPNRGPGEIWLDGDVILCVCPDCSAPMSVRFWLMLADCWRCGASIELSEEQERQVQQLLAERQRQTAAPAQAPRPPAPRASAAKNDSPKQPLAPPARPAAERFRGAPRPEPAAPARPRPPQPEPPAQSPPAQPAAPTSAPPARNSAHHAGRTNNVPPPRVLHHEPWLKHLLNDTPAWFISMLLHLVAFTVLALLFTDEESSIFGRNILLSTNYGRNRTEGGDTIAYPPDERAEFDLPLPSKADLNDNRQRNVLLAAAQDARELRLDDDTPNLPNLQAVKVAIGRADGFTHAVASRDPRLRTELVKQEGGTTLTEAAVARGLRWLSAHQNADGSWSIAGFSRAGDCECSGDGVYRTKSPGTALAMLPFLGAGQTHLAGKYKDTVSRGLRWLIENQKENGDLRAGSNGNEGMYTHGQAAIVLCEAFAMTGDEELRVPAQKAINFVAAAQYNDGGWRYQPGPRNQQSDTSVVGWQLMALQSARAANLTVPEETWARADLYLDGVQHQNGALYSYQSRSGPTPTMTAEGLLCRMYLGWKNDRPALLAGATYLAEDHLPSRSDPNIYYWYYGTQVLHHLGGPQWDEWNRRMRDVLVISQETRGHAAGSWRADGQHGSAGGRIYMTSLAVCTLEVYYRHLPLYRQLELGK